MITQKTILVFLLSSWGFSAFCQQTDSTLLMSDSFEEPKEVLLEAKKHFLLMLKLGNEIHGLENEKAVEERGKAIGDLVPIYETRYDTTSFIRYAEPNERFEILSRDPGYAEVMTKDGTRAYIKAGNIASTGSINKFKKKASNKLKPNLDLLARLYEGIDELELKFTDSGKKVDRDSDTYKKITKQFESTIENARSYYKDNFEEFEFPETGSQDFLNRISGQVRLSQGQSRYGDNFSGEVTTEQKSSFGRVWSRLEL